MTTSFQRLATRTVLAATVLAAASFAASAADSASAASVQQALVAQMGASANELSVSIDHGNASLGGWAKSPREVDQARYIVSQLPGVAHAYSSNVHTWASDAN